MTGLIYRDCVVVCRGGVFVVSGFDGVEYCFDDLHCALLFARHL